MAISRRIYKQGNSLVISIPAYMWSEISRGLGDRVNIDCIPGRRIEVSRPEMEIPSPKFEGKKLSKGE